MPRKGGGLGSQLRRRSAHHRQVDLLHGQRGRDLGPVAHLQLDLHLRVQLDELQQHMRQQVFGGGHRADAQRAGDQAALRCHRLAGLAPQRQQGVLLGLIAAFAGKWVDAAIMRVMDIVMALPSLLMAVAIMAILGPGLINAMIAIALVSLPAYVRLVRASA